MGFRETYGGMLEEALNKAVDKHLAGVSTDAIKQALHEQVDKLVDQHLSGVIDGLAHKLKADVIDLIDGENDLD